MGELGQEFLRRLKEQEEIFLPAVAGDRLGIGLVSAIREVDLLHYRLGRLGGDDGDAEQLYLLRLALPVYIRETFIRVPAFDVPVITFARDRKNRTSALALLGGIGMVEHARRMAYASMAGLCRLSAPEPDLYQFSLPADFYDYEQQEASVEQHYMGLARQELKRQYKGIAASRTEEQVDRILKENVYVFRGRYIGYNAHPLLDEYFYEEAYTNLYLAKGFDAFQFDLEFGGLTFLHYILCVAFLLSLSRKHVRFCEALIEKHPDIRMDDILTITASRDERIDSMMGALNWFGTRFESYRNIDRAGAETLYKVLSLRRDNTDLVASGFMAVPMMVEFSDTAIADCVSGLQAEPITFLLESLRYNFPREFDRNQRTREASMQRALRRMLAQEFPQLTFRENIRIRRGRQVATDIDLVVIEPGTATAMLLQLKHQDAYSGDMKRRNSRSRRLVAETSGWLSAVQAWLAEAGPLEIASTLQLKQTSPIRRFHIVAVCRNYAHFLHPLADHPQFAYASWMQFHDALVRMRPQGDLRTLSGLFGVLRRFMSHQTASPNEVDPVRYDLPSLSYQVVQEGQDLS